MQGDSATIPLLILTGTVVHCLFVLEDVREYMLLIFSVERFRANNSCQMVYTRIHSSRYNKATASHPHWRVQQYWFVAIGIMSTEQRPEDGPTMRVLLYTSKVSLLCCSGRRYVYSYSIFRSTEYCGIAPQLLSYVMCVVQKDVSKASTCRAKVCGYYRSPYSPSISVCVSRPVSEQISDCQDSITRFTNKNLSVSRRLQSCLVC